MLPGQQTVASDVRHQPHGVAETNIDRVDVESWKLESERIKEKMIGEKGKSDFEEQLRELDAEISGKANTRCNMEKVLKARELVSEVKLSTNQKDKRGGKAVTGCNEEKVVSTNKKEEREGEDSMHGLRCGLHSSRPYGALGRTEVDVGLVEFKNPLAQVMEPQVFQVGPKILGVTEQGSNKKAKSPNRKSFMHMHIRRGKKM